MKYRTCPYCGSNLDPGEHCDCQDKKEAQEAQEEPEEEDDKCA